MRTVFMGSPEFAVPCLNALNKHSTLVSVVCQPDRPAGRGLDLHPPAVKVAAAELNLPVLQPTKLKPENDPTFLHKLQELDPELIVVVAYGRILPPAILAVPRHGAWNVHASKLPRYRGAAPVQWSLIRGDQRTAVTLMQMDPGLDTGPVYRRVDTPIGPHETSGELFERLAALGAEALDDLLAAFPDVPPPRPQGDEGITHAAMLSKEEGRTSWERGVRALVDHVRGMDPWPVAYVEHEGEPLKLFAASASERPRGEPPPGTVVAVDDRGLHVAALDGVVCIGQVQPAGKRRMPASAWAAGRRIGPGARL